MNSQNETINPEVGMGCFVACGSDRNAATIIEISKSGNRISVQYDCAIRTDSNGYGDKQEYRYTPNPFATIVTFSRRQNGQWVPVGDSIKSCRRLVIGKRITYYDPHI